MNRNILLCCMRLFVLKFILNSNTQWMTVNIYYFPSFLHVSSSWWLYTCNLLWECWIKWVHQSVSVSDSVEMCSTFYQTICNVYPCRIYSTNILIWTQFNLIIMITEWHTNYSCTSTSNRTTCQQSALTQWSLYAKISIR